ncbi:FMN-binding protein [Coraliomargarita algicola]|uniref:FMN-binding protein n=1 Tax=Coraliomargarita algicola TaxID=3092156 RepID=A0ABZ0RQ37_9BACT|nr:FMN-binding protein [Coraliomargarita sp. J2-16]WPJ97632.1 FMN-binding protein [Coraliomargarita sp. J2-16]
MHFRLSTFSLLLPLFLVVKVGLQAKEDIYLEPDSFIQQSFEGTPEQKVLWLTKETKARIKAVFGSDYPGLRIRYWQQGPRTAWILEEIGKVKPITTGFLIEGDAMLQMRVLIYRESHGWEVRYPFFTDQFTGLQLSPEQKLNKKIDGISGATLSVNALTRLSKLALFLHQEVTQ